MADEEAVVMADALAPAANAQMGQQPVVAAPGGMDQNAAGAVNPAAAAAAAAAVAGLELEPVVAPGAMVQNAALSLLDELAEDYAANALQSEFISNMKRIRKEWYIVMDTYFGANVPPVNTKKYYEFHANVLESLHQISDQEHDNQAGRGTGAATVAIERLASQQILDLFGIDDITKILPLLKRLFPTFIGRTGVEDGVSDFISWIYEASPQVKLNVGEILKMYTDAEIDSYFGADANTPAKQTERKEKAWKTATSMFSSSTQLEFDIGGMTNKKKAIIAEIYLMAIFRTIDVCSRELYFTIDAMISGFLKDLLKHIGLLGGIPIHLRTDKNKCDSAPSGTYIGITPTEKSQLQGVQGAFYIEPILGTVDVNANTTYIKTSFDDLRKTVDGRGYTPDGNASLPLILSKFLFNQVVAAPAAEGGGRIPLLYGGGAPDATPHSSFVDNDIKITIHYDTQRVTDVARIAKMRNPEIIPVEEQRIITVGEETHLFEGVVVCTIQSNKFAEGAAAAAAAAGGDDPTIRKYVIKIYKSTENLTAAASPSKCGMTVDQISRLILLCENMRPYKTIIEFLVTKGITFDPFIQKELRNLCLNAFNANQKILTGDGGSISVSDKQLDKLLGDNDDDEDEALEGGMQIKMVGGADVLTTLADALYVYQFPRINHTPAIKEGHIERIKGYLTEYESEAFKIPDEIKDEFKERMGRFFDEYTANALDYREVFNALIDAGCTIDQLQKFALAIKFCGDLTQIEGKHSFEKAFESLCVLFSIDRLCCKKNWKSGKNSYTRTNDNFLYLEQGDLPGNATPEKKKEAEIASTINDILAKSACNENIAKEIRELSAADGNQQLLRRNVWVNLFGPASNTPIGFDNLPHPFLGTPILVELRETVVRLAAHATCYKCIMDRNAVRTLDGTIFLPDGIANLTQQSLLQILFTDVEYSQFFDVNGYLIRDLSLEQLDVIYHELEMKKIEDNNRNNLVKAILYRLFGNESPWSVQKTKKGYKSTRLDLQMFDGRRVLSVQSHNIDLGAIYNALNEMHAILRLPDAPIALLNDKIAELAGSIKKFFNNSILSMGAFACTELLPPVLRGILFEVKADIDTILPNPDARSIVSQFNLLVLKLLNAFKVEILASTEQNGELKLTDAPILELTPILPEGVAVAVAVAEARQAALERLTTARDQFAQIDKDFKEQQRILGQELNKLLSLCTKKPIKTTQAQMSKNVQDVFPDINMKLNFILEQIAKLDNLRPNNNNKYYSTNFKTYILKQLKKFKDAKANDTYKFAGILAYRATFYDNCIRLLESYLERITKRIEPAAVFPRSIPLVADGPKSIGQTKKTGNKKKEYIEDEHAEIVAAAALNEDEEEPEEPRGGINKELQRIIEAEYTKNIQKEYSVIESSDARTDNITEKVPTIRSAATVRKKNSPPTIKVKATSGILTNMMENAKKLLKKYIKNKGSLPNKRDKFNSSVFDAIIGVYQKARREAAEAAAEARREAAEAAVKARREAAAKARREAGAAAAAAKAEAEEAAAAKARRVAVAAAAPAVAAAKARREAAAEAAAAAAAAAIIAGKKRSGHNKGEAEAEDEVPKKRTKGGYDIDLQYGGVLRYDSANYSNDDIGYTYEDNDVSPEDSLALLECLAYLLLDANGEPSKAIVDEEIIESVPLNIEEIKENYMYTLQQIPLNIYSNGRVSSVEQLILRESDILQFIHYILRELDGNGSFERLNIELAKESETISANLKEIVELTKEIYTTVSSIINEINSSKDPFDTYNTFIDRLSDAFNKKEPTHSTMDILLKAFPLSGKGNSRSAAKNNSKNAPVTTKSNSTIPVAAKSNTKNAVAPIVINSNPKNAPVSTTVVKNNTSKRRHTQEQSATILNLQTEQPNTKSGTRNRQRRPNRPNPSQSTKQKSRTNPNLTIADPNLVPPSTTLSVIQSAQPEFREQSPEQFKRPIQSQEQSQEQSQGQSYQPDAIPVNGGWSTRKRRRQYKKKSRKQKQ